MATWQLIEHTSRTLLRLIEAHLAVVLPGNTVNVRLATPHVFPNLRATARSTVTIFLYRVCEHTEQRNGPQRRLPDGSVRRAPLVLELSYLVTTWGARNQDPSATDAAAASEEHQLLGIVMQALFDHAEVGRAELFEDPTRPPVWGERDNLQIILETLTTEDLYRIWDSSELPYQLSATYRVRVLGLESTEILRTAAVIDANFQVGRAS